MVDEELGAEALERLLDPLMRPGVSQPEHIVEHLRRGGHEHAAVVKDEAAVYPPGVTMGTRRDGVPACAQGVGVLQLGPQVREELERGDGQRCQGWR